MSEWTPIKSMQGYSAHPSEWTLDGIHCHDINRNCGKCPIYQTYGRHHLGGEGRGRVDNICKMASSVQYLLNQNRPKPEGKALDLLINRGNPVYLERKYIPDRRTRNNYGQMKLTMEQAREIRALKIKGMPFKKIAQKFDVSEKTCWAIVNNRRYQEHT